MAPDAVNKRVTQDREPSPYSAFSSRRSFGATS
jgi:hypothetical protein